MSKTLDAVFMMNGVSYDGLFVTKLARVCSVLDGDNAGRLLNGSMVRDIIGSFFSYEMEIDSRVCEKSVYDRFYEQVTRTDVDSHLCRFAYGQDFIRLQMYVAEVEDELILADDDGNRWGNLKIKFVSMYRTESEMKVNA